MSSDNYRSSRSSSAAAAARRKARRRRAIRNRIIFAAACLLLLAGLVFLGIKLFGGKGKDVPPETNPSETAAETPGTTEAQEPDSTPPMISGVEDITVEVNGTVSYKRGIRVTDDTDPTPKLSVNADEVDLSTPGTYSVVYIAEDASGNTVSVAATVTVVEPKQEELDAELEAMLQQVRTDAYLYLKEIKADAASRQGKAVEELTQYEIAQEIWLWCNWNLDYTGQSDKSSWIRGAYQYFETHKGDCFTYYAAAKALLDEAGIENCDIMKSDTTHSSHYWSLVNLGDGWYHFDTTPREGNGDYFFLVTDAQLDAYSEAHENSHIFDHEAYPARAEAVITDMNAQPDYQ